MKRLKLKSKFDTIIDDIHEEYCSACKIHPIWPINIHEQFNIISEEHGEAVRELNRLTDDKVGNIEDVKKEVIQEAAMCIRFLINLKEK